VQSSPALMADPAGAADGRPQADIAEQFGPGAWRFTREVAGVFDEHVRASVPFYDAIQQLIAETADWLVPAGGLVADLGCSTGNTAVAIAERQHGREITFHLYDEAPAMTAQAVPRVAEHAGIRAHGHNLRLPADLLHGGADLTVAAFALQFMDWPARVATLETARAASSPAGALIVAEKVRVADSRWAEIGQDVSHDYKSAAGISDTAIRAKARSLRGVLRPATMPQLAHWIHEAGWSLPHVLFAWHQWVVLGAFAER
jgi:tRNA (cmo5U34)-methyltransferase